MEKTTQRGALCSLLLIKYRSGNQIKMTGIGMVRRMYWGEVHTGFFLVGKPEARRPIGRPRRRWEGNNEIDHGEVGWGAWTGSIWLRIGTGSGLLLIRQ